MGKDADADGGHMPERIVISLDDLSADTDRTPAGPGPEQVAGPPPLGGSALPPPAPMAPSTGRPSAPPPTLPQAGPLPPLSAPAPRLDLSTSARTAPGGGSTRSIGSPLVSALVSGLVAGIAGMVISELLKNPSSLGENATTLTDLYVDFGIYTAIFGAVFGAIALSWNGLTSGSSERALRDGLMGLGIGLAAGFLAGYAAGYVLVKMVFDLIQDLFGTEMTESELENRLRLVYLVWGALLGGGLGMAMGIPGGPKRIVNGLIGGIVGGSVGFLVQMELLLQTSGSLLEGNGESTMSPYVARLIGLAITGAGIALGLGVVDRLRRDAWLLLTSGPMAGKEYILFKTDTTVGTGYQCDIVLAKDRSVAPRAGTFHRGADGTTTVTSEPGATIAVNGAPVTTSRLRAGDVVTVGMSSITFQERTVRA